MNNCNKISHKDTQSISMLLYKITLFFFALVMFMVGGG